MTWHRMGETHPLAMGHFTFVSDTRISADYNQRTNEWSLIIQDVNPTDDGVYSCIIHTKEKGNITYDIQLNVESK